MHPKLTGLAVMEPYDSTKSWSENFSNIRTFRCYCQTLFDELRLIYYIKNKKIHSVSFLSYVSQTSLAYQHIPHSPTHNNPPHSPITALNFPIFFSKSEGTYFAGIAHTLIHRSVDTICADSAALPVSLLQYKKQYFVCIVDVLA